MVRNAIKQCELVASFAEATLDFHWELPSQLHFNFWNFYSNVLYFLAANKIIFLAIRCYIQFYLIFRKEHWIHWFDFGKGSAMERTSYSVTNMNYLFPWQRNSCSIINQVIRYQLDVSQNHQYAYPLPS